MIELNGIYKLKRIKGFSDDDTCNYKVIKISKDERFVCCEMLDGYDVGERFVFLKECLIDPDKPDDIYFGELVEAKN